MDDVTLEDVASAAGVSRQTVSRAINGKPEIKAETRTRVLAIAEELGYRPNFFARSLVTRRSFTVGLVMGDITNPFFPDVARGVQDVAEVRGYNVFVCNFGGPGNDEVQPLRALANRGVDGVIFFTSGNDLEGLYEIADTYSPMVVVNSSVEHKSISSVQADLFAAGGLVADHFADTGRRHPAVIAADYDQSRQLRVLGFKHRCQELGLELDSDNIVDQPSSIDGGVAGTVELLDRGVHFDSIFAFNDLVAVGSNRVLQARGIKVPDECSLVGCDDLTMAEILSPPLTSIHMDRYGLGASAMEQLLARLGDAEAEIPETVLPVRLTIRSSSQPPVKSS